MTRVTLYYSACSVTCTAKLLVILLFVFAIESNAPGIHVYVENDNNNSGGKSDARSACPRVRKRLRRELFTVAIREN